MIDVRFVPVERWPGEQTPASKRKTSPFEVKYAKMLDDLERELNHLAARDILIQAHFRREDIRNDGWPRSSAPKPSDPGVILTFIDRNKQEISFPCDTYRNYESNLRAISLTLTALRAIDRYGVTRKNEQYKGWAKLPPAPEKMGHDDALAFFEIYGGVRPTDSETLRKSFRNAAAKLHPDNLITGNAQQFNLLTQAQTALRESFGW